METAGNHLLSVRNLTIRVDDLFTDRQVVRSVSFAVKQNETFALVGESGSGKTMTALSLLGLMPAAAYWTHGEIRFNGEKITPATSHILKNFRGTDIAFIFQNAKAALNPLFQVGRQIQAVISTNLNLDAKSAREQVLWLFEKVKFSNPERIYRFYPHQLSGGMAQRVMIAMALSCHPKLIIADEPTTGLDVTTQVSILQLISRLQEDKQFSLMLISHDLQVVAALADRIAVMKNAEIIECNSKKQLFQQPKHDYTKLLFSAAMKPEDPFTKDFGSQMRQNDQKKSQPVTQ